MSATSQEVLQEKRSESAEVKSSAPVLNRVLDFLSSVRFGVVLLCVLVAFAMVGMLIIQQNVNGFDAYFASLTPAEKAVYGFLGLFDIYRSWYFNFLLLVLSLNIVLASIDRFPQAWSYIREPKTSATRGWLLRQKRTAVLQIGGASEKEIAERIGGVFKANGLKPQISQSKTSFYAEDETGGRDFSKTETRTNLFVFGESGRFNRLGAYIVHVALLTLFLGHFVALQSGFDADVRMMPGQATSEIEMIEFNLDRQERYSVALPFTINCTDIEQNLIDPKGSIDIGNTLNWHTRISIDDPQYGTTFADVSLNKPFEYRGYRFFQASAITVGSARNMILEAVAQTAGVEPIKINLARNGSANLPDGTKIDYEAFFPDFVLRGAKPDTRSAEYNNPAVKINITTPNGEAKSAYAFGKKLPDNIPVGAPVAGYKWRLSEFEKSPLAHVLSIKYDPYSAAFIAWYIGGFGLIGALVFVFFLSHRRIWALIKRKGEHSFEVVLGGDANRNEQGLEDKFNKIVQNLEAVR
ncbi:MAG: cytochrome c biogenesis protein ResB [Acidobacteria bacterium]|nr:cytochrome c biogenesis protein ResB [Acidobacteriota bacterium]